MVEGGKAIINEAKRNKERFDEFLEPPHYQQPHQPEIKQIAREGQACIDDAKAGKGRCHSDLLPSPKETGSQTRVKSGELIVCVSLSMPEASLRSYFIDVQRLGGRLVIQGLVGDSFKKTQERLTKLQINVDIDPEIFRENGVSRVPMILHRVEEGKGDSVQGNISLSAALEAFAQRGDYPIQAKRLLKTLRGA